MSALLSNIRFALRLFAKAPGFTAAAVLSLALGIGANVTVYTWMRQLVLEPLPGVTRSRELVAMDNTDAGGGGNGVSYADFRDMRAENTVLQGIFAGQQAVLNLQEGGESQRILTWYGSWDTFQVLGVQPAQGRFFQPEEDRVGQPNTVVLSHRLWMRRFGGDPGVVGRSIRISGASALVVGVAPEGFYGPLGGIACDLYVPLEPFIHQGGDPEGNLENRRARSFYVMARPRPGISLEETRASLRALSLELARRHPRTNTGMRLNVYPISEAPVGAPAVLHKPMALLFVAVAFLLLIACANVANLLLAKAAARQRELAVRASLGADRGRLVTQLLTESLMLGLAGGLGGALVSFWCLGLFQKAIPPVGTSLHFQIQMDGFALGFACLLSLVTSMLFGVVPALRGSDRHPAEILKQGDSRSRGSHRRVQSILVVAEIAIAVTLLAGAGLMVKSSLEIQRDHPGFEPKGVLYADLGLNLGGYDGPRAARFALDLRERLRSLPGVESVSFSENKLLGLGGAKGVGARFEDVDLPSDEPMSLSRILVGPDFFSTFRIPLAAGREISDQDTAESEPVVMVNETLVRRFWGGRDPVGKRIRINGTWRTVVGVSQDFKFQNWTEQTIPFVYIPLGQFRLNSWNLVMRVKGPASAMMQPLRQAVASLDPGLPVIVEDMEEVTGNAAFLLRMSAQLLGGLGLVALFLAAVGIYSVMAYGVNQRRSEIGLRMALGASPQEILKMVLKQGSILAAAGCLLGLAGALILGHRFADLLYRTRPVEPLVLAAVPLILGAVALAACALPALRAARMAPTEALRGE